MKVPQRSRFASDFYAVIERGEVWECRELVQLAAALAEYLEAERASHDVPGDTGPSPR